MIGLDDYARERDIRKRITSKAAVCQLYKEFYSKYSACIERCPTAGLSLEIGSGAGFLKEILPSVVTTDILSYKKIDLVMDACALPFPNNSIRSIFMLNTLHHIPDAKALFFEIDRCLMPGGRVLIIDQYHGWFSRFIYKYIHHEPYFPQSKTWEFKTSGPISGANGALCWIIFYRDRSIFERLYPSLRIVNVSPNTPLRYWLSGGLKWWSLLPSSFYKTSTRFDNWLSKEMPGMSSFVDVELVKHY